MKKYLGNKRVIIFLIAPAMILISVMVLYPMLVLVVHSFTEWDGLNPATFNGISNYIKLFKDPIFYTGLKNGLIFAGLQALIQIPLADFHISHEFNFIWRKGSIYADRYREIFRRFLE